MKNLNQRHGNRTLIIVLSFIIIISTFFTDRDSFSQENDGKYGFIAIFKDTLIAPAQSSEKEIILSIVDNDIRRIINKDSIISLNSTKDTIWTFDITIDGRRCYGTVFSGPVLTKTLKDNYSGNIIFLYSSSNALESRLLNGIFIYISEESNWKLVVKTE